jgi:hypothetical protein
MSIRCTWYVADLRVCGHIRAELPARNINRRLDAGVSICVKSNQNVSDVYSSDIAVFQRSSTPDVLDRIKFAKSRGVRTAYDIDDDFFSMPDQFNNPFNHFARPEILSCIRSCMEAVDVVFASTQSMADAVVKNTSQRNVIVLPNFVDFDHWAMTIPPAPTSTATVLGWMASGCHVIDSPIIGPVVSSVLARKPSVALKTIGHPTAQWFGGTDRSGQFSSLPWMDIDQLPAAMSGMDVGLCPLADHPYNRAKSSIKALQHWSLGQPVVVSDLDPYRGLVEHGVDGFVCRTHEEWVDAIERLVDNSSMRIEMGERGREKVASGHNIAIKWPVWADAIKKAMGG